jgi:ACS family hexuronate transporter-like MFS transporter
MTPPVASEAPPATGGAGLDTVPFKAWLILGLLSLESIIAIVDRQNISALKTTLKGVFGMTDSDYSWVVNAFLIPYALFFPICGLLVDRYGSRRTLSVFVIVWSAATIACGFARSMPELIVYRAIIGAAEAGLLPASLFALIRWFPKARMGTAGSLRSAFQSIGPIICTPLVVFITLAYGWRYAFLVPGVIGLAFGVVWYFADSNPPRYRDKQERAVEQVTVRAVATDRRLWGVLVARVVSDPLWFFLSYWQAGFLQEKMGLSLKQLGMVLWIPPLVASLLMILVGLLSDRLITKRGMTAAASRIRIMQAAALLAPVIFFVPFATSLAVVMLLLTTAYFVSYLWLVLTNILVTDLFRGRGVGVAVGLMSMFGTIGASVFTNYVGRTLDDVGYVPVFILLACMHPVAALVLQIGYGRSYLRSGNADTSGAPAALTSR